MSLASQSYARWLRAARRHVPSADEAPDLLHDALIVSIEAGRQPLLEAKDAAWFHGVLRRQAALRARGTARRRERERRTAEIDTGPDSESQNPARASWPLIETTGAPGAERGVVAAVRREIEGLPPSLRRVMTLILHGLDRDEIRQVLDLADTALRQRLSALKRRLSGSTLWQLREPFQVWLMARNSADAGLQRAALARGPARVPGFRMGVSDPDGHLLSIHVPRRSGQ